MKKFLSLVLALTMALSLAVVGASATAYSDLTDKSAITHTAAVEAMNERAAQAVYEYFHPQQ